MIKDKKELESRGIEIDLTGPEGNAFILLGYVKKWCKQLNRDFKPIQTEMMSGDYDNLVDVIEREFGDVITFYR